MVNQRIGGATTTTTPKSRASSGGTSGQAGQAVQQATDTARETVSKATETAKQQADSQLDRVSSGLQQMAQTLHQTGGNLRENGQAMLGGYVEKAAGQVEHAADYLRVNSVTDMIEDVQSYARREPVVAIGVAVGIGFLAARLLKASMQDGRGSGTAESMRYQTRAYSADGMDAVMREQSGVGGTVGTRYGNGA